MATELHLSGIAAGPEAKARRRRYKKWIFIGLLVVAAAAIVTLVLLIVNWPFTERGLIDVLQERSVRSVTIGHFHITYFPPGCVAEQISFLHRKHKDKPPLITIERISIRGSYWGMISPHKHLSSVRVDGMHVIVPPPDPSGGPNPIMPLTHSANPGTPVSIGTVVADGTVLEFIQRTPGKPPVRLTIHKLGLEGVGNDRPLNYRARIYNTNPPGIIDSKGSFGTWDPDNPASTPVQGWYTFTNANLGVYKVISGTLTSTGSFGGNLGAIAVRGSADVPNFHVTDSSHTRELRADFDATVAATDGNVILNKVLADFDHTTVAFTGAIEGQPKEPGKAVALSIQCDKGRIEDLLRLVIEDKQAPMSGNVSLRAQLFLPREPQSFLQDMRVDGQVGVGSGKFSSQEIQTTLARVTNSASKKDALPTENAATLVSELDGGVTVRNGTANLSNVQLEFPGGAASLSGSYNLMNYDIDLHGELATDGSPSAATTGFKAVILKAASPFLKKDGNGRKSVPFKISGNYHNPNVGLDLRGNKK